MYELLEGGSGSKGSTTYSVACRYSYVFDGRRYSNDKVGVESGSSSDRSLYARREAALKKYQQSEKPFPALVNPDKPSQAILIWMC